MTAQVERFTRPRLQGISLRFLRWGRPGDPAILLLHGGGANAHWWDHVAPALSDGFEVVALEFRGHGESDSPARFHGGDFEHDVQALIEHLDGEPAVWVGHSMGGEVALALAARGVPARALVLIDLARGVPEDVRRTARRALTIRRRYRSRDHAIERFRFIPPAVHVDPAVRERIATHSIHEQKDGTWSFKSDGRWTEGMPSDAPSLSAIECPVLLLRGAESPLCTDEGIHELASELPHARHVTIERAGHHAHLDAPDGVVRAIRQFVHHLG